MIIPLPILDTPAPVVRLEHLDDLWFQVGGTRCNLTCQHCFISCSPHNHAFGFLNLDLVPILELTLRYGPATVLTNGTVLKEDWLDRLAQAEAASPYSLEFRVSIDGFSPETHDPVRGDGTFDR